MCGGWYHAGGRSLSPWGEGPGWRGSQDAVLTVEGPSTATRFLVEQRHRGVGHAQAGVGSIRPDLDADAQPRARTVGERRITDTDKLAGRPLARRVPQLRGITVVGQAQEVVVAHRERRQPVVRADVSLGADETAPARARRML